MVIRIIPEQRYNMSCQQEEKATSSTAFLVRRQDTATCEGQMVAGVVAKRESKDTLPNQNESSLSEVAFVTVCV